MILKFVQLFSLCVTLTPFLAATARPNVLFISIDDLNDFVSFSGRYPAAQTPHMDRLASQGMVFTNAHCQYPVCGPSRASVMSGMLPSSLGFETHMKDQALQRRVQKLGTELLHTYFARQGYKTLAVGKILHRHLPKGSVEISGGRGSFRGGTGHLRRNWSQKRTITDWAQAPERDDQLPDHEAASWAVEQLQAEHQRPFFLMVGFLRPHVPWYAPQKWFDLYDKKALPLPAYRKDDLHDVPEIAKQISVLKHMPRTEWAIETNQWRDILHAYLACVSFVDHQVGRVLNALASSRYSANTVIVLWSDHGYHLGEKNTFQKHSLWERSSHVPFVLAGPKIKQGLRCDRVVSLLDLYPTLLDLCELPPNPRNEGRSLLPLLKQPKTPWPYPAVTGWQKNSFALQDERFRYIRYGDGSEELYDHQVDLPEFRNLAGIPEFAPVKQAMATSLDKIVKMKTSGGHGVGDP